MNRDVCSTEYDFVKEARNQLFTYCSTIQPADFIKEVAPFGRGGSMRNLLVHIANVYEHWIGNIALKQPVPYSGYDQFYHIEQVVSLYTTIDELMTCFLQESEDLEAVIPFELNGVKSKATLLKIFTHTITHEFHHKGQIHSISRSLGYTPVDTDIIHF
ncbi:damage-inducible protein DinB [Niabella ginsenosidivorans]|uniref:Damage-inducible protein DinB n=1 Tax=Niabella ginsenosidivorans TaxID=1176587 RepID=A0A1A9HXV2_9BACT|nr:DinB family protein [Niabella ginsenosidivorans]ANH80216.1 damage-inducible protein DinB [Niabella ginsenosidivorans]